VKVLSKNFIQSLTLTQILSILQLSKFKEEFVFNSFQIILNIVSSIHEVLHENEYVNVQIFSQSSSQVNVHTNVQTKLFSSISFSLNVKSVGALFKSFIVIVNDLL
jgi:hypothetical protein